MEFTGFRPAALTFFRRLARQNTRAWFEAHREDWIRDVRDPMRAFVEATDVTLARIAPELVGDPTRSIFRIYRDVRFARDKTPYKTHAACWFYHRDGTRTVGNDAHGGTAGIYFQLAPGEHLVAGGIWMPPKGHLANIREALQDDHRPFATIVRAPALRRRFGGLSQEAVLSRVPRGVAPDHPAAEWLRFKSFTVSRPLTDAEALHPDLPRRLAKDIEAMLPLVRWLNRAIGFAPATGRLA